MNLHENLHLFVELLEAASQPVEQGGLGIRQAFLEKDYWVTRSLELLSQSRFAEQAVFKGGTSLSKAYGVGFRFSEDIDIAITSNPERTDNQTKSLVGGISKVMSVGLEEIELPDTRKFSKYRKVYYRYPQMNDTSYAGTVKQGIIQLEVVSFANPYPFQKRKVCCLLREFLLSLGRADLANQYGLAEFEVNVLDIGRTATEKMVSLVRQSLGDDSILGLRAKIRHFYDLHYLQKDAVCRRYLESDAFPKDFERLLKEDQARFAEPTGWQGRSWRESPLLTDFAAVWELLQAVYERELPQLAFRDVPGSEEVAKSFQAISEILVKKSAK